MRVIIEGQAVRFDDEKGVQIHITTEQLLEMVRILNTVFLEGNRFFFNSLEFTV